MKELSNGVFELTDEQLAKVVGGRDGTDSCPNHYTECTVACLNVNCSFLVQNGNVYSCGIPTYETGREVPVIQSKFIN